MWPAVAEACASNPVRINLAYKGLCYVEPRAFDTFFSNEATNTVMVLKI